MSDPSTDKEYQAYLASKQAAEKAEETPEFYVHLADGNVVKLSDDDLAAAGSHYDGIAIVNSYRVGA